MNSLLKRSFITALIVGSILVAINQWDLIINKQWSQKLFFKILLTPIVPFCVSYLSGLMSEIQSNKTLSDLDPLKENDFNLDLKNWKSVRQKKIKTTLDVFFSLLKTTFKSLVKYAYELAELATNLMKVKKDVELFTNETVHSSQLVSVQATDILQSNEIIHKKNITLQKDLTKVSDSSEDSLNFVNEIEKEMGDIQLLLNDQKNNSEKIQLIMNVISNIVLESKLLSFNASVEASRAGDAGKGFAVVASEIKKLSDSTALNAKSIDEQLLTISNGISIVFDRFGVVNERLIKLHDNIKGIHQAANIQVKAVANVVDLSIENNRSIEKIKCNARVTNEKSLDLLTVVTPLIQDSEKLFNISIDLRNTLKGFKTGSEKKPLNVFVFNYLNTWRAISELYQIPFESLSLSILVSSIKKPTDVYRKIEELIFLLGKENQVKTIEGIDIIPSDVYTLSCKLYHCLSDDDIILKSHDFKLQQFLGENALITPSHVYSLIELILDLIKRNNLKIIS